MKKFFISIICFYCFISCTKTLSPNEYIEWFKNPDNGYIQTYSEDSGLIIEVIYKPSKYMALISLKGQRVDSDKISKIEKQFDSSYYFQLNIKEINPHLIKKNSLIYYQKLEYLSTQINNDIKLISAGDTIPCSLHHFERNYGVSPDNRILLVFDKKNQQNISEASILFDDQFFHHKVIHLNFDQLSKEPNIKIKKS